MARIRDSTPTGVFAIDTRTLCLDLIILAAVAWPSGFGYSIYAALCGRPLRVTRGLLATLAVPFLCVVPAVWVLRPDVLVFSPTSAALLAFAVILAPLALLIEYGAQALVSYLRQRSFPRQVALHSMWRTQLRVPDHALLGIVAAGEEIFYRLTWCGVLRSLGVPVWAALIASSAAYGLNHLALGPASVISKSVVGTIYGSLFLFGGSLWLSITTHIVQNLTLLTVMAKRDG